jgi:hypothetical protein
MKTGPFFEPYLHRGSLSLKKQTAVQLVLS